uniref:LRR-RLK n=1 Tax=Rhizophora mucronata TaxID=61149 RepID=A0A2P2MEA6_RHIMU
MLLGQESCYPLRTQSHHTMLTVDLYS